MLLAKEQLESHTWKLLKNTSSFQELIHELPLAVFDYSTLDSTLRSVLRGELERHLNAWGSVLAIKFEITLLVKEVVEESTLNKLVDSLFKEGYSNDREYLTRVVHIYLRTALGRRVLQEHSKEYFGS